MKVGHRRFRQRRTLGGLVCALGFTPRKILDKDGQRGFRLAEKDVIGFGQVFDGGGYVWATELYPFAEGLRPSHDISERFFLHQHRRGEYHVRPLNIRRLQRLHVQINQSSLPRLWQQSRDRQQPQGRKRATLSLERQRVPKTPIRIGKFRVDQ